MSLSCGSPEGIGRDPLRVQASRLAIVTLLAVSLGACKRTAPAGTTGASFVVRFSDPGNTGIFAYAKREGILERGPVARPSDGAGGAPASSALHSTG